ncbi:MAG: spore protease YyaC [Bacteroides sp.]|nr:spore protease YyaC [Bacteroides sp.]MCM1550946.1 spore protease YyaC [Clostridium sp.]
MKKTIYFDASDQFAYEALGRELYNLLENDRKSTQPIIILCIGTDRVTGDSLGPLVGHQLHASANNFIVYGNLEQPVHAINLIETLEQIYEDYENPYVIAIDASLGSKDHVGYVTLRQGPLKPGQGISKDLPAIGDISITGIVNLSGRPGAFLLQNTRLYTVMKLVDCITLGINLAEDFFPPLETIEEEIDEERASFT